jgi:Zn-dependent M28 family amino/carboxypeptidase
MNTHHAVPLSAPATVQRLKMHVQTLATEIGGRLATSGLEKAATYIEQELRSSGYAPQRQVFTAAGHAVANIETETPGMQRRDMILILGAHYDTAGNLPGANDNGSGVAALLELARHFATAKPARTIRWVFFTNEEPPFFQTPSMGSYVYAKRCHERREDIRAMLSLETIGYYTDEPDSQTYPTGFHPGYPDRGNFLGFVAELKTAFLLRTALRTFRAATSLPAQGVVALRSIPGIGWSDHWSFWQFGYKALMLTDTAPFRYPHYHTAQDTAEKLQYARLADAVQGIAGIVVHLAGL